MSTDFSLVICTLDESESIGSVLTEAVEHLSGLSFEIIVVDASADARTADVVRAHAAADGRIRLLQRTGERGLAAAAAAGWAIARGRLLGLMDGDGQHDPAVLPRLIAGVDERDADIGVASRYARGAHTGLTGFRHRLSQVGTILAKVVTGASTSDPLAGMFVFTRTWWDAARPRMSPIGYKVLLDLALSGRRTPVVFEAPTALRTRLGGGSKLDCRVIADLAAQLVEKRSNGLISARFALFGAVGCTGVIVNLAALEALTVVGLPYWAAQAVGVITAMISNFMLNNILTFRDRRLKGAAFWQGMLAFCVACTSGAILNQSVGMTLHGLNAPALVSGLSGAVLASLWNYAAASKLSWGAGRKPSLSRTAAPSHGFAMGPGSTASPSDR
ncbi:glycosyltransferase [soil metagenome]